MLRLPSTARRVEDHTSKEVKQRIRDRERGVLEYHREHPHEIQKRLHELNHEWDVERALQLNFSLAALTGLVLGVSLDRRFLVLTAAAAGFLGQHALLGWCPPLAIFRRLGLRTSSEIEDERRALLDLSQRPTPFHTVD